jgi:DNA-binding XRE family transcriptional regulator
MGMMEHHSSGSMVELPPPDSTAPTRPSQSLGLRTVSAVRVPPGTSPMRGAEALYAWERLLPPGSAALGSRHHAPARTVQVVPEPASLIREVGWYLGLTKTDLKTVLGVSRQTLYEYLAGKYAPVQERMARIEVLHSLARVVQASLGKPLPAAVVQRPLRGGASLLSLLSREVLDVSEIHEHLRVAYEAARGQRARSAAALREKLGYRPRTAAEQAATLADNLDALARK